MAFLRLHSLRQRVHAFTAVGAVALAAWSIVPAYAADYSGRSVIGQWKFTAALDGSEVTGLDEREAQQLVGHIFTISKDRVAFDNRDCGPPGLQSESVAPNLYLREQAHASASKLGLPNPVTVVDVGCTVVFIKKPSRMVIHWKGWFFDAVRVKR